MIQAATNVIPAPGRCVVLNDIDWKTYTRLLRLFADRPGVRLTYDHGELEIMAPSLFHDSDDRFLLQMVGELADAFNFDMKSGGSVTMRRRRHQRGIEGDETFWLANAARIVGVRELDLRRDPPPDLAIEVDVTHSSMDRLSIYAVLGVSEVWRVDGDKLIFYVLGPGPAYTVSATSQVFPGITPADLMAFVMEARTAGNERAVLRRFREWLQQRGQSS